MFTLDEEKVLAELLKDDLAYYHESLVMDHTSYESAMAAFDATHAVTALVKLDPAGAAQIRQYVSEYCKERLSCAVIAGMDEGELEELDPVLDLDTLIEQLQELRKEWGNMPVCSGASGYAELTTSSSQRHTASTTPTAASTPKNSC